MDRNSECQGDTARYSQIVRADARFEAHAGGHTSKVLFFTSRVTGHALAIEKRKGLPTIYIQSELQHRTPYAFGSSRLMPKGDPHRNSNLKRVFGDKALLAIKPEHDIDFLATVACLV